MFGFDTNLQKLTLLVVFVLPVRGQCNSAKKCAAQAYIRTYVRAYLLELALDIKFVAAADSHFQCCCRTIDSFTPHFGRCSKTLGDSIDFMVVQIIHLLS